MYCSKCGTENDDNSHFCNKCGAGLNETTKEESSNFNDFTIVLEKSKKTCTLSNDSLSVITKLPFQKKQETMPIKNIVSISFERGSYIRVIGANTSGAGVIVFIIIGLFFWWFIWILIPLFIIRTNILIIETINGKIVLDGDKELLESFLHEIEKRRA